MYTYFEFAIESERTVNSILVEFVMKPIESAFREMISRQDEQYLSKRLDCLELWINKYILRITSEVPIDAARHQLMFHRNMEQCIENLKQELRPHKGLIRLFRGSLNRLDRFKFQELKLASMKAEERKVFDVPIVKSIDEIATIQQRSLLLMSNKRVRGLFLKYIFLNNIYINQRTKIIFVERYFLNSTAHGEFWAAINANNPKNKSISIEVHTVKFVLDLIEYMNEHYPVESLALKNVEVKFIFYESNKFFDKVHDRFFQMCSRNEQSGDNKSALYFWGKGLQSWVTSTMCTFGMIPDICLMSKLKDLEEHFKKSERDSFTFQLTQSNDEGWTEVV